MSTQASLEKAWRAFNKAIKCPSEMALRKSGRPLRDGGASEHRGACAIEICPQFKLFLLQYCRSCVHNNYVELSQINT